MVKEHSAGAIVFRRSDGKVEYLLLDYGKGHWEFTKGNIESGEKPEATARREIEEETGLKDLGFVPGFKEILQFFYKREGETVAKDVVFFLAESKEGEVKVSEEHQGFKWLGFEGALKQIKFESSRKILEKANKFLKAKEKMELTRFFKG